MFFIETEHGILVEIVRNIRQVPSVLKEMNERGSIPKRAYRIDSKGRKVYLK